MNEFCSKYKQAKNDNKLKLHSTKMKNCKIIDNILFRKDLLWVSENCYEHVWINQSSDLTLIESNFNQFD